MVLLAKSLFPCLFGWSGSCKRIYKSGETTVAAPGSDKATLDGNEQTLNQARTLERNFVSFICSLHGTAGFHSEEGNQFTSSLPTNKQKRRHRDPRPENPFLSSFLSGGFWVLIIIIFSQAGRTEDLGLSLALFKGSVEHCATGCERQAS